MSSRQNAQEQSSNDKQHSNDPGTRNRKVGRGTRKSSAPPNTPPPTPAKVSRNHSAHNEYDKTAGTVDFDGDTINDYKSGPGTKSPKDTPGTLDQNHDPGTTKNKKDTPGTQSDISLGNILNLSKSSNDGPTLTKTNPSVVITKKRPSKSSQKAHLPDKVPAEKNDEPKAVPAEKDDVMDKNEVTEKVPADKNDEPEDLKPLHLLSQKGSSTPKISLKSSKKPKEVIVIGDSSESENEISKTDDRDMFHLNTTSEEEDEKIEISKKTSDNTQKSNDHIQSDPETEKFEEF